MAPLPTGTAFCMARPRMREKPRGVGDRQTAGGGERGIFAERMAGDERDLVADTHALRFQHAHRREADGHQRRLGVLGERQGLQRPLEDDLGQLLAERLVDRLEDRRRLEEAIGERLAHADRLTALPGKGESYRHPPRFIPSPGGSLPPFRGPLSLARRGVSRWRPHACVARGRSGHRPMPPVKPEG